ncbi:MAG UNVERIFIED_CONTAM: hypothetical protein LVR18_47630 [Planctomycetaceae bacterium]
MTAATADINRIGFSAEIFEQFLESRQEPAWITEKRRAAFETYQSLLTADLDPEEFKRVDLRIFNAARFRPSAAADRSIRSLRSSSRSSRVWWFDHPSGRPRRPSHALRIPAFARGALRQSG